MQIDTNISKKQWSRNEIDQLHDLYGNKGMAVEDIAVILGRTKNSVWVKIKRLKIKHSPEQTFKIKQKNMAGTNNPMSGKQSWCKGETKETNAIVKDKSAKQSVTRKELFAKGILDVSGENNPMYGVPSWNNGLTTENCDVLKKMGKKSSILRKKEWANMSETEKDKRRKHCAIMGAKCKKSKTTIELKVEELLKNCNVKYMDNHYQSGFVFDFYLPDHNVVIECQGDYWHSNPRKYSNTNMNDIQRKNIDRDNRKKKYLSDNGIPSLFLWEYDIRRNFRNVTEQIKRIINNHE